MSSKRVIRSVDRPEAEAFDEQLWPIWVALVVLGGFLAGMVLSLLTFDDPRVTHNAATYLTAIPILILFWMWLATRIDRRWMRRAVMLALVLSVTANVGLLIFMQWTKLLNPRVAERDVQERSRRPPVVTVPEPWPLPVPREEVQNIFESPVPTETYERQLEETTRNVQPVDPTEVDTRQAHVMEPAVIEPRPQPRRRAELAEATPRESETPSLLRRQSNPRTPRVSQAAREQQPRPTDAQPAVREALEPEQTAVARRSADAVLQRSPTELPPAAPNVPSAAELARRDAVESPRMQSNPATAVPRSRSSDRVPPTEQVAIAETRAGVQEAPAKALQPHDTRVSQAAPEGVLDRPADRSAPAEALADAAATPAALPRRDASSQQPALSERGAEFAERRSPQSAVPPLSGVEAPLTEPTRDAGGTAQLADAATAQEAATALSRAITGTAGLGRNDNVDQHLLDPSPTGPRPADLTRRALPPRVPGPAIADAPGLPARQGRVRTDQVLPPTSAEVTNIPIPADTGMAQADAIAASEAAAVRRSGTNSQALELLADGGQADWDLGPTQRVAEALRREASSGGGQPVLSDNFTASALERRTPAGAAAPPSSSSAAPSAVPIEAGPFTAASPPSGEPVEAAEPAVRRPAAGIPDVPRTSTTDALAGAVDVRRRGTELARREVGDSALSPSDSEGPWEGDEFEHGALLQRAVRAAGPLAVNTRVEAPSSPDTLGSPDPSPDAVAQVGGLEDGPIARRDEGSLMLDRQASEGPAGLSLRVDRNAGLSIARAEPVSENLELQRTRFLRKDLGGPPSTNTTADMSVAAFNRRERRFGELRRGTGQPPPKTEEAIELGLVFLNRHQSPDGRWSLSNFAAGTDYENQERTTLHSDTAATGLALLAFLGAGYHHQDDKYQDVVRGALQYLISQQHPDGNLYVADDQFSAQSVALYSHGIAALALCEAYGMTQDPDLREPAQRALDYIVETQHPRLGGWRYVPGSESDTSVSGWMVMALKSGELAQLEVPVTSYEKLTRWLDFAQADDQTRHLYRYNPLAPDNDRQRHGRYPTTTITAVGLLSRMYIGWRRDNQWMQRGSDYLLEHLPEIGTSSNPQRDTYYWYYATQVMFHMGGERWETWNGRLHPLLIESQIHEGPLAGSWDPRHPVPDRWAWHAGRVYVTTMNLLSLEVYYRHLPLYEETAR